MHCIYAPINNRPLPLTKEIELEIGKNILAKINEEHGKDKEFEAELLLYMSEPAQAMIADLLRNMGKFPWLKRIHISIDPLFEQKSLDEICKRMTGRDSLTQVICFRVLPRGMLDKGQAKALRDGLSRRFGEVYIIDIPEVTINDE